MLQRRKRTYDSVKVNRVGTFGQVVTQSLIPQCQRVPNNEGDFFIPALNSGIEVKFTDSLHEWRLPLHQLEFYGKLRSFPYDGFWFFLFVYRNWYVPNGKPRGPTALAAYNETIDVNSFIAGNLQHLFILDIEFIQGLKDKEVCRVSDNSIPLYPGRKSLNIRPARMRGIIADDSWKGVVLDPQNWVLRNKKAKFRCRPDMFERYDIPLNIHIIGRKKDTRKISRLLSV